MPVDEAGRESRPSHPVGHPTPRRSRQFHARAGSRPPGALHHAHVAGWPEAGACGRNRQRNRLSPV